MTTENTNQNREFQDSELNVLECPLTGTVVVEAGAGTGKTYNIESLYVRLILQQEAKTSEILAVTFTEAAAKELRTRIRARLTEVRQALEPSDKDKKHEWKNAIDGKLVENLVANGIEKSVLLNRCREALADFDAAPVFTIHGFCRRMLNDHTFESGIRYGQEMRGDPQENIDNAYLNFYRRYAYENSKRANIWGSKSWFLIYNTETERMEKHGIEPGTLQRCTYNLIGRDEKEIEWGEDPQHDSLTFLEFLEQMEATADPNAEKPFSDDAQKETYLRRIQREAVSYVKEALKRDKEHESFMTFDDLLTTMKKRLEDHEKGIHFRDSIRKQFKYAFIDEFQDTDDVQNAIFRMLFRDDPVPEQLIFLIGDPKQAIYGFRNGDVFTYLDATKKDSKDKDAPQRFQLTSNRRSSREFIKALNAMREIRESATTEDGGFFLQNDIKFPEIRFPEDITPGSEWRLLRNGVDVKAEEDNGKHPLLNYDFLGNQTKAENVEEVRATMTDEFKAMVEGRRLSIQEPGRPPRPVRYSDIAVLCTENAEASETAKVLRKRDIPCVIVKEAPLFGTPEAKLVQNLMAAILDPSGTPLTNLINLEGFFPAFNVQQLNYLKQQELPFCEKLRDLLRTWQDYSFRAMFSKFLKSPMKEFLGDTAVQALGIQPDRTVSEVLLDKNNGDKSIFSTLLQIQESLNQAVVEQRLGPEGLTRFLQQRIKNAGSEAKDYPLQRTSEENAVQLMTIHSSKGLQFPIVYVLGMLSKKNRAGLGARFHKKAKNGKGVEVKFDMNAQKDSAVQQQATLEENQEFFRLFYVAVTRARLLCRFLEANNRDRNKAEKFFSLLQGGNKEKQPIECLPHYDSTFPVKKLPPLNEFLSWLQEGTSAEAEPSKDAPTPVAEGFPEGIDLPRGWCTCSFSSLAQDGGAVAGKGADGASALGGKGANSVLDELESDPSQDSEDTPVANTDSDVPEESAEELAAIFRFPRGKLAGTCWHEILEKLDFQGSVESQKASLWEPMLDQSSQLPKGEKGKAEREARIHAFGDMLEGVLETKLPDPVDSSKRLDFALKDIPQDRRQSELRFYFRLKNGIRGSQLAKLLDSHGIPRNAAWAPYRDGVHGWVLNGSLDLLFQNPQDGKYYILDWKTNALNQKMSGFDQAGMEEEMKTHFYHLQYLLYTVAFLHAYKSLTPGWELNETNYNALFGGVIYCFLRGVTKDPQDTNGFYATRPEFGLIKELFDELQPCAKPADDAQ